AQQTAEAIVRATGATIEQTPLLHERNFGDLRGRAYAEIGFDIFAPDYAPPGGETWPQFEARVERAWAHAVRVAAAREGSVAVVTHGLVCHVIAERFLSLGPGQHAPERWANTSLTVCSKVAPHAVELLNCVAHLEPGSADRGAPSGM